MLFIHKCCFYFSFKILWFSSSAGLNKFSFKTTNKHELAQVDIANATTNFGSSTVDNDSVTFYFSNHGYQTIVQVIHSKLYVNSYLEEICPM